MQIILFSVNRKRSRAVVLMIAIMWKNVKACVSESNCELPRRRRRPLNEVTGCAQLCQVRMSRPVTLRYCYTVGGVKSSTIPVRSQSGVQFHGQVRKLMLKDLPAEPLHQTGSIYTANHENTPKGVF